MTVDPLRHLSQELADLECRGLLRERPDAIERFGRSDAIHLCSNDYLGYRATGRLVEHTRQAALTYPAGSSASRLVFGEHAAHRELERALSSWLGVDETLVFTSGYAANVGTIAALAAEGDLIVSDVLNHASIIDGCRLSRARVAIAPHNAPDEVRRLLRSSTAKRRWVVAESYFSMDGDGPDLRALRAVCDELDAALILDEAHALGALGPQGRGRAAEAGVTPDVLVGTFGKSLASQGSFVAGTRDLCRWLWNRARSFVFSTGLSPLLAAIAARAVEEARRDDAAREHLRTRGDRLRHGLVDAGLPAGESYGPILPIVLGQESTALDWSRNLAKTGIIVQAIRPPTVPAGTSRLRVTVRADLTDGEVDRAVEAFAALSPLERGTRAAFKGLPR